MSCGGCTPFSLPGGRCSGTGFPSRMDTVERPATVEERNSSVQTVKEIELLGVEEKTSLFTGIGSGEST